MRIVSALAFSPAAVEHVGSTAVAGLIAKPILDIAIAARDESHSGEIIDRLKSIGYRYHGWRRDSGGEILDYLEGGLCTQLVHVVTGGSTQWQRYLLSRDYLRLSEEARSRYESAKRALAAMYPVERKKYTAAKESIIDALVLEARAIRSLGRYLRQPKASCGRGQLVQDVHGSFEIATCEVAGITPAAAPPPFDLAPSGACSSDSPEPEPWSVEFEIPSPSP